MNTLLLDFRLVYPFATLKVCHNCVAVQQSGDRGVAVGAGSYDGESALAVGVHFSGENSRFKLAVTSADGETGASVGAGWSF